MIIASIDIGTNTVLLLIVEIQNDTGNVKVLEDEYRIPRIGRGLAPANEISPANIAKLHDVLNEYMAIISKYNCGHILAVGTNALRVASNGGEIIKGVKQLFNIDIKIISGEEEAELAYTGAVKDYGSGASNLVIDIGGGSTELILGTGQIVDSVKSFPVGVVIGMEKFNRDGLLDIERFNIELENILHLFASSSRAPDKTIAVAGTPTTLASLKKKLPHFIEKEVEGSILTRDDIENFVEEFRYMLPSQIAEKYDAVIKGREDLILSGACILLHIMKLFNIAEIIVSTKGIRYGLVYKWLLNKG